MNTEPNRCNSKHHLTVSFHCIERHVHQIKEFEKKGTDVAYLKERKSSFSEGT